MNITELMADLGPRTQSGLNRCIYPAVHLGFENSSRKIMFFQTFAIRCFHLSNSNIIYAKYVVYS